MCDARRIICLKSRQDESASISYWLHSIDARAKNVPIIIVGTHVEDKRITNEVWQVRGHLEQRPFPLASRNVIQGIYDKLMHEFYDRFPNIVTIVPISNRTGEGIDNLKKLILDIATNKANTGAISLSLSALSATPVPDLPLQKNQMAGQKIPTSYLNLIKFVESALKKARQQNTPPWMPLVEFRRTAITYLIEGFFFFFFWMLFSSSFLYHSQLSA